MGQDLRAGYVHNDGIHHHLYVCESLVFLLQEPEAIHTLAERKDG